MLKKLVRSMGSSGSKKLSPSAAAMEKSMFQFTVKDGAGAAVDLASYRGKKAYLVVNVATE